jgi:nucleoside-triphosphatase THEP1
MLTTLVIERNLLAQIAKNLAQETPPLPDDVEVIDNILKMKLKANQFAMHVENISSVATRT